MNGNPDSAPLSSIAKIRSGGTPSKRKPEYWGGETPWVSAKDMKHGFIYDAEDHLTEVGTKNGTKVADVDEILILVRGMTLHHDVPTCRVKKAAAFNQDVKAIAATEVDPGYLYYALRGSREELLRRVESAGHGTGRIPGDHLATLPIPRFGKKEESNIASLLGALDDKIELNRRMSATLEEMARALYRSWFVDFDPVHARALGQPPAHMDPTTAALFPDSFNPDGLPKGWERKRLGDLLTLNYGKALKTSLREPGPYPVYGSGGTDTTHTQALVSEPTIIVGRKGTVGSVMWEPRGCWPIDTTFYVTSGLSMSFILRTLQHLPLADMNTDAAVPGLNRENAYRLEVPVPKIEVLEAFDGMAATCQGMIDHSATEAQTIAALRDTLLPRLMSGELRIREAEKRVEEVV